MRGSNKPRPSPTLIRVYLSLLHDRAGLVVRGRNRAAHCFILTRIHAEPHRLEHRRFAIGAVDEMAETAAAWSSETGWNVYVAPVLYRRADLPRRSRGTAEAIAWVLGLGADVDADHGQDTGAVSQLKPTPSLTIVTSRHPRPNLCPVYLFERPLAPVAARPIAAGLCRVLDDRSGSTADINHVWRLPGCLGWVSPQKARRRGLPWPCPPDVVALDAELGNDCRPVAMEDLQAFLDVEAETRVSQPAHRDGRLHVGRDIWNGDAREERRLLDALRHIDGEEVRRRAQGLTIELRGRVHDIRQRETWLRVGMALHIWYRGDARGFESWRAVSAGDAEYGFTGAPEKWNEADAHKAWRSFAEPRQEKATVTVGSIFHLAGQLGFDTRRLRYGLGPLPRHGQQLCPAAKGVLDAGRAFDALRDQDGRDQREDALRALRHHVHQNVTRKRALRVFDLIVNDLHRSGEKGPAGVAWRGTKGYCALLSEHGVVWDHHDFWRELENLRQRGVIVSSPGNRIGAHGRIGASYAVTPPEGQLWPTFIGAFLESRGHRPSMAAPDRKHPSARGDRHPTSSEGDAPSRWDGDPPYTKRISTTLLQAPSPTPLLAPSVDQVSERGLQGWLDSGDLPSAIQQALRSPTRSRRPDAITGKLDKMLAAGVTVAMIASQLEDIERRLKWSRNRVVELVTDDPDKLSDLLRRVLEEVTLLAGDHGIDRRDVEAVQQERRRRRERFQRASSWPAADASMTPASPADPKVVCLTGRSPMRS